MKEIQLTKGQVALVDDEDYEFLMQWKWWYDHGYARASINGKKIYMHRLVMNITDRKILIDHTNLNTLNNQKYNLRICNKIGNSFNRILQKNNTTGYRGVVYHKKNKNFTSNIKINGKHISLGSYNSAIDAARVYDEAALKYGGEFARLNFPKETNA